MESSPDRENSQEMTENRVADDTVHKHGAQEVSSEEDAAAAASSVGEPLGRVSGSERLEESKWWVVVVAPSPVPPAPPPPVPPPPLSPTTTIRVD